MTSSLKQAPSLGGTKFIIVTNVIFGHTLLCNFSQTWTLIEPNPVALVSSRTCRFFSFYTSDTVSKVVLSNVGNLAHVTNKKPS
jgi:hypothetical protein